MGKGKKASMPTFDAAAVGQQQAQANQQAWQQNLQASRSNQNNPMGSLTWEQDPTTGQWTQNINWNPQQQANFDQQQANQGLVGGLTGNALKGFDASQVDFSGAPAMPKVGGYNQQAIDTMRALQAPQLEQQRAAQEAKLAAMGLNTGSGRAWENAQRAIGTNENQANLQAVLAGINQGNTEYGQALQGRQQGVNEILAQKQANLGQLSGLMGMNQWLTNPTFAGYSTPNLAPVNYADLAAMQFKSQQEAANAKNASKGGLLGGLMGIAGTALGGPIGGAIAGGIGNMFSGGGGGGSGSGSGGGLMGLSNSGGYGVPMPTYNW